MPSENSWSFRWTCVKLCSWNKNSLKTMQRMHNSEIKAIGVIRKSQKRSLQSKEWNARYNKIGQNTQKQTMKQICRNWKLTDWQKGQKNNTPNWKRTRVRPPKSWKQYWTSSLAEVLRDQTGNCLPIWKSISEEEKMFARNSLESASGCR